MTSSSETLKELTERKYQYGFVTDIEADQVPKGLSEEIIRIISARSSNN